MDEQVEIPVTIIPAKNKIIFGRKALGVPTPLLIKAILKWLQRSCLVVSTMTTLSSHEYITVTLVCLAGFFGEIEPLFGEVQQGKIENEVPIETV